MNKTIIGYSIIILFHFIGLIGMINTSTQSFMANLTPLHLILCYLILLFFHSAGIKHFLLITIATWLIGMLAEIIGVHTGLLFGTYRYSSVLGPSFFKVPLIIGINWFLLCYTISILVATYFRNRILIIFLAALLITSMDYLIEPAAIVLNFWHWENDAIPIYNYISWFFVSSIIMVFLQNKNKASNKMAVPLLVSQFLFFLFLNLFL